MNDATVKHYNAWNCNRRIKAGAFSLTFEACEYFAGSWRGIYATENPEVIAALDELAQTDKSVTAISKEEYETLKKKCSRGGSVNSLRSVSLPSRASQQRIVEGNAVVVESPSTPEAATKPPGEPLGDVADALNVGSVALPPEPTNQEQISSNL